MLLRLHACLLELIQPFSPIEVLGVFAGILGTLVFISPLFLIDLMFFSSCR